MDGDDKHDVADGWATCLFTRLDSSSLVYKQFDGWDAGIEVF